MSCIIFDWKVVYDHTTGTFRPGAMAALTSPRVNNFFVNLVLHEDKYAPSIAEIKNILRDSHITFHGVVSMGESKDRLFYRLINNWDVFEQVKDNFTVVDNRPIRGIRWANKFGIESVLIREGPWRHELPNKITGNPTFTVENINEINHLINANLI